MEASDLVGIGGEVQLWGEEGNASSLASRLTPHIFLIPFLVLHTSSWAVIDHVVS